jgi:hypothetical protein
LRNQAMSASQPLLRVKRTSVGKPLNGVHDLAIVCLLSGQVSAIEFRTSRT